jgi:hypothetical protein
MLYSVFVELICLEVGPSLYLAKYNLSGLLRRIAYGLNLRCIVTGLYPLPTCFCNTIPN